MPHLCSPFYEMGYIDRVQHTVISSAGQAHHHHQDSASGDVGPATDLDYAVTQQFSHLCLLWRLKPVLIFHKSELVCLRSAATHAL